MNFNHEIAENFIGHIDYRKKLVYCYDYDLFYLWDEYYYRPLNNKDFELIILNFIRINYSKKNITKALIKDLAYLIKLLCLRKVKSVNSNYLAFKDCYINLKTFKLEKTDYNNIVIFSFPFVYSELDKDIPNFKRFISTSLVKDSDKKETDLDLIELVHEMFGFFLLNNLKGASAFFLLGRGRNGKSIMTGILEKLFTQKFCSAMSIQSLTTDKFAPQHLIGKKINISNEEESKYMKSDKFKALITGDLIQAEKKFGDPFEFKPTTKYIFSTNNMPTFDSLNIGLKRRIKFIPFHKVFTLKEQDQELEEKLVKELPGIMRWAIEGAKKIINKNYIFTSPKTSTQAMEDFEDEISSPVRFVRESFIVYKDGFNSNEFLYNNYQDWCRDNGKKSLNRFNFIRDILDNVEGAKKVQGRDLNFKNSRGINLITMEAYEEAKEQLQF